MSRSTSRRLLVVEDDALVAMVIQDCLEAAGWLISTVGTVTDGVGVVGERHFDVAVLDINLHGEKVYPVADALDAKSVPFAFVTGHSASSIPERFRSHPLLAKPFDPDALVALVGRIASRRVPVTDHQPN
jgi:DNA-binding response OmpR family regulator